jgi:hypothetical protein
VFAVLVLAALAGALAAWPRAARAEEASRHGVIVEGGYTGFAGGLAGNAGRALLAYELRSEALHLGLRVHAGAIITQNPLPLVGLRLQASTGWSAPLGFRFAFGPELLIPTTAASVVRVALVLDVAPRLRLGDDWFAELPLSVGWAPGGERSEPSFRFGDAPERALVPAQGGANISRIGVSDGWVFGATLAFGRRF